MSDKLDLQSPDLVNQNIEKLASLFPNCVTEGPEGKSIDFDLLRQELNHQVVEGTKERYRLEWPGKKEAIVTANLPTTKTLRPVREDSVDFDNTENLYIEGDNLEVLKLLQESYLGKIKMIYIDPPYNTGKDFVYKDNYSKNSEEELLESGQLDEYNQRLVVNPETAGRYHSDWLSMIYPRLKLCRNLLANDGIIFISIADEENSNLKKLCDEVFGEGNFIAQIIRNTNSSKNQSLFVSVSHDYCLIYSKSLQDLTLKHQDSKWAVDKNNVKEYVRKVEELRKQGLTEDEISSELKQLTKYPRFIDFTNYWYFDANGLYRKDNLGGVKKGNMNPIFNPLTKTYDPVPPGGFRYNQQEIERLQNLKPSAIHFHTDGSLPVLKRYLNENLKQRPKSIMSDDQRPDYAILQEFNTPFDNPKQLAFMERILSVGDKDCIVLDFFSGSGTTAHAVMNLNSQDKGQRKFIQVQLPEITDENSEAKEAGFNNISEIGKQRIRQAGKKIKEETGVDIDYGFRVYRLDSSNMQDVYYRPQDIQQGSLDLFADHIKPDRNADDLLAQVMLDWGLPLSMKIVQKTVAGKKVFQVAGNSLMACFDSGIDEAFAKEIATDKPLRIVFRDASFRSDTAKENVKQLLKQLSPETEMKVI